MTAMSKNQKEALLKLFENPNYQEFGRQYGAKVPINKSKSDIENFWSRAAPWLNQKGPSKTPAEWRKSYFDACRYAISKAKSDSTILLSPDGVEDLFEYTTGNPDVDRIMRLIGWEAVFSPYSSDFPLGDEKENFPDNPFGDMDDELGQQGSRSPLSSWKSHNNNHNQMSATPSPPMVLSNKRSLSPLSRCSSPLASSPTFSAIKQKRSLSPLSRCSSPAGVAPARARGSSPAAPATASPSSYSNSLAEIGASINRIAEALEKNTRMIQELKEAFESATVTVIDTTENVTFDQSIVSVPEEMSGHEQQPAGPSDGIPDDILNDNELGQNWMDSQL